MKQQVFHVIAHYRARPGKGDDVAASLIELAIASRREEDNVSYDVARSLEDDDHFVIVENYSSEAAFTAHRGSEHFQQIGMGQIIPLLMERTVSAFHGDGQA